MSLDPTTIRVSDTLLLSDLVGCDSVYRRGYANPVLWGVNSSYFAEARRLGELLDEISAVLGPYSVSYGYICDELSRKIVKYQSPDKPSYHRWDQGAAADVCFHQQLTTLSPIQIAQRIDQELGIPYSRLITYSESEWICFGVRCDEEKPRKALYENRYVGQRQPRFVRYSANVRKRAEQLQEAAEAVVDWRGQGYPSYHGGGREQFHHIRLADNVVLSDLLYKSRYVHSGVRNLPPLTDGPKMEVFWHKAERTANVLDVLIQHTQQRVSVVRAYDRMGENDGWGLVEFVPHRVSISEAQDVLRGNGVSTMVRRTKSGVTRIGFYV